MFRVYYIREALTYRGPNQPNQPSTMAQRPSPNQDPKPCQPRGFYAAGRRDTPEMQLQPLCDKGFKDAILTLETCCKDLKLKHRQEIEGQVKMLDISHQLLYAEYQDSCSRLMTDEIAVLLFFTSVLAKRLYEENETPLIESVVGWQTTFLHDFTQWILEHNAWLGKR